MITSKFNELFEQYARAFAIEPRSEVLALRLDTFLQNGEITAAKDFIDSIEMDAESKHRAMFVITANNKSAKKGQIERLGKELIRDFGTEIDFQNLSHFYFNAKKWGDLAYLGQKWYDKHTNVLALRHRAIALYNQQKRNEAMAVLREVEQTTALTPALLDLKINILIGESQFDDAIAIIKESGFRTDDEMAVLQLAALYADLGDNPSAIVVLREFVNRHPESVKATTLLIQHFQRENQNEAYKYAKQLASHYPNDLNILMRWMNIGFTTNHDDEVGHLYAKIIALQNAKGARKKGKYCVQIKGIDEVVKILQENQEQVAKTFDLHFDNQAPIHAVIDQCNAKLGDYIYNNWQCENGSVLYWHYGGKPDTFFAKNIQVKQIILDYTACLTSYCMGLFQAITGYFDVMYIEPHLIQVINSEITLIKNSGQASLEEKETVLLGFIDTHKDRIHVISQPEIGTVDSSGKIDGIYAGDINLLLSAKSVDAYIVTDTFGMELEKEKVPQEYEDARVRRREVCDVLIENDYMQGNVGGSCDTRKLKVGDSIVVDSAFLTEIAKSVSLSDFTKLFKVFLPKPAMKT